MRTVCSLLFVAIVLGIIGCRGTDRVSKSIGLTVAQGKGTQLTLAEHTPFQWNKVCIFGPYSADKLIEKTTGVAGSASLAHDIRSSDMIDVLMFIDEGRITNSIAHSRGHGDFGPELVGKCYSRAQAVFLVRRPPQSWGNIGPYKKIL